jgi:hypothetical protein
MRFRPGYSGGAAPLMLGFPVRRGGTNLTLKIITQNIQFYEGHGGYFGQIPSNTPI